jgi:hypothetical protein
MKPLLVFAFLLSSLVVSGTAFAHSDRILPIGFDGVMADVPAQYGPASLKVNFARPMSESPPITSLVLKLGQKRIKLPACITGLLRSRKIEEVVATGSWYHDESTLPYYLSLTFFDPGYSESRWANSGVQLLFNLRTGKILAVDSLVVGDNGRSIKNVPVELKSRCAAEVSVEFDSSLVPG